MSKVKCYLLCIVAAFAIGSCKKNGNEKPASLSAAEILTAKPWKLLSYGFDHNKNGMIDSNEESIRDCEADNSYSFNADGSGVVNENSIICDGNDPSNQFTWALRDNDTVLDFFLATAHILKLSPESLHITDPNSGQVNLLLIFGH